MAKSDKTVFFARNVVMNLRNGWDSARDAEKWVLLLKNQPAREIKSSGAAF